MAPTPERAGADASSCAQPSVGDAAPTAQTLEAPPPPTFREALRYWAKLGFLSFGGPAGQIAMMHRDLVEKRRWISETRFLHALNFCMLLPGPEATQLATYIGWLLHRRRGGLAAGVLFILPSVLLLLGLSYLYSAYGNVAVVAGVLSGFKPAVVAIVLEAVLRIGKRALQRPPHLAIAAVAFVSLYFLAVPFPLIVLGAGLTGILGERWRPHLFAATKAEERREHGAVRYVLDDDTPTPPHALPSRTRALGAIGIALALWVLPYSAIVVLRGDGSLHAQQYRFFTVAAFVTFGGAYSVLSYVTTAAVQSFGWLSRAQTVDGLALAETTPGPLIMVLQFIGFTAAWNHPEGLSPLTSAVAGAVITTWTTFLPTYLLVFLGAPYIESLRGNRSLAAALGGITAAVVGVILNLALVFGEAVVLPKGIHRSPDWLSLAVAAIGFVVLHRLKKDVTWVVLGGGLVGLVARLLA